MMDKNTKHNQLINRVKNNWILAIIGIAVAFTITISQFGSALKQLWVFGTVSTGIVTHVMVQDDPEPIKIPDNYQALYKRTPQKLVPPILDIKILNHTKNTHYLNKIVIAATRKSYRKPNVFCAGIIGVATGFYDVALNLEKVEQIKNISISHVLKPDETDRVMLSLYPDQSLTGVAEFDLSIILKTIEGKKIHLDKVNIELEDSGSCYHAVKRMLAP